MPEPISTRQLLLKTFMQHKGERHSYFTPAGLLRKFEALPIVVIVSTTFIVAKLYLGLYYVPTRTELQFKLWPPLQDRIDLKNPRQCKYGFTHDYSEYKPLEQLSDLLLDMNCAELDRKQAIKDWQEEKNEDEGKGDPCAKRKRNTSGST